MLKQAAWAKQFLTVDFYNDYPTNRESGYGLLTKRWMAQSRNWMKKFFIERMGCKPEDIIWNKMYYEWSMFAKIGEQWWYFSTGDVRFKVVSSLLVRTAQGPKDYTGGRNQSVYYYSDDFAGDLERLLKG